MNLSILICIEKCFLFDDPLIVVKILPREGGISVENRKLYECKLCGRDWQRCSSLRCTISMKHFLRNSSKMVNYILFGSGMANILKVSAMVLTV